MAGSVFTCVVTSFRSQRGEERTWARAACAQEGDHPQPAHCRRHRPRRSGQHALPWLLQRQKQTAERSAVRWVSDWRGQEGKEKKDRGAVQWLVGVRREKWKKSVKQCSDKWRNISSKMTALCGGATTGGTGVWCPWGLGFFLPLMKSCEAVTLDVTGYRSLNCYLTVLTSLCHWIHFPQTDAASYTKQAPGSHCLCSAARFYTWLSLCSSEYDLFRGYFTLQSIMHFFFFNIVGTQGLFWFHFALLFAIFFAPRFTFAWPLKFNAKWAFHFPSYTLSMPSVCFLSLGSIL